MLIKYIILDNVEESEIQESDLFKVAEKGRATV